MNMPSPLQFASMLLQQNPNLAQDPKAKEIIDILQSGDSARGTAKARELCQGVGVDPNQAASQAQAQLMQAFQQGFFGGRR